RKPPAPSQTDAIDPLRTLSPVALSASIKCSAGDGPSPSRAPLVNADEVSNEAAGVHRVCRCSSDVASWDAGRASKTNNRFLEPNISWVLRSHFGRLPQWPERNRLRGGAKRRN